MKNTLFLFAIVFIFSGFKHESFRCIRSSSFKRIDKSDNVSIVKKPFSACWNDKYFSFTHPELGVTGFPIASKTIDHLANGQTIETIINGETDTVPYGFYGVSIIYGNEKKSVTISFTRGGGAYIIESSEFSIATDISNK
jgi:hypothetical protein